MEGDKINRIIESKNADLEREAVERAGEIINSISQLQAANAANNERIAKLRAELKDLEIEQIDATKILGA